MYRDLDDLVEQGLRSRLSGYFRVELNKRKDGSDGWYFGLYPKYDSDWPEVDTNVQQVFLGMITYKSRNDSVYINYKAFDGRFYYGPCFSRSFTDTYTLNYGLDLFCNYIRNNPFINIVDKIN